MAKYNVEINKYNSTSKTYDQLYPKTELKNVEGLQTQLSSLQNQISQRPTKQQALATAQTLAKYGLSATATNDDLFNAIAKKSDINNLMLDFISTSRTWTAPKAKEQVFLIFAVGGGGSGERSDTTGYWAGGGSGYITRKTATISAGTSVNVVCGAGGSGEPYTYPVTRDGGTTSFGNYATARGGKAGGSAGYGHGGDGGAGGGGDYGGNAGDFGGGGGGFSSGGKGGTYGGNGGWSARSYDQKSKPGTSFKDNFVNILFNTNVPLAGKAGLTQDSSEPYFSAGDGGFGGNGGVIINTEDTTGGSGGGGYCGNGGANCPLRDSRRTNGAGGGGGYCGNGGNAGTGSSGGGGGFFCNGGDGAGEDIFAAGGGGGFFDDGKPPFNSGRDGAGGGGGNGGVLVVYFKEG